MTYTERLKEFNDTFQADGTVYHASLLIPDVVNDDFFRKPEKDSYEIKKYNKKTTVESSVVEKEMNSLIQKNVSKSPIFTYFKRKSQYYEAHVGEVKERLLKELNEKEKILEEKHYASEEERIQKQYEHDLEEYEKMLYPSEEWLNDKYQEYKNKINEKMGGVVLSSGGAIYIEKTANGENKYELSLLVESLNEFGNKYLYKYGVTSAGNPSKRQKTDKQIEEEYVQNVTALAFINAVCLFNVSLDVNEVIVSASTEYIDSSTGNEEYRYLYSVVIPRALVKQFKMENLNPVAALTSLSGNVDIRKEREIYFVEPITWNLDNDKESYNDNSDENETIDVDFRRMNCSLLIPEEAPIDASTDEIYETISQMKDKCKEVVLNIGLFEDEFDADNYAGGLSNFLSIITLIKNNEGIFCSENKDKLEEIFRDLFDNNSYAMGEISKIIEHNIFERIIIDGETDLIKDRLANHMLVSIFSCDDDD